MAACLILLGGATGIHSNTATCPVTCTGTNAIVTTDANGARTTSYHPNSGLPYLPRGTIMASYGETGPDDRFNGTITFAGPLALTPGSTFYSYAMIFIRSLELFARWMNNERGGIMLNGGRYAVRFGWVDEGPFPTSYGQVTNATATALRVFGADFAISGARAGPAPAPPISTSPSAMPRLVLLAATRAAALPKSLAAVLTDWHALPHPCGQGTRAG
jgi:hypothetical protein